MSTYKITPLCLGHITRPKKNFFYGYTGSEVLPYPLIAYFLDGEHKILVDTGGCAPDEPRGIGAQPYTRTPEEELPTALAAIGLTPDDIEYVIFTHLHWDHAYNNHLFPNAVFYCQKKEYEGLIDPATEKIGYVPEEVLKYEYTLIDGDAEVFPGIYAIHTPGHTPGGQCLIVDTDVGKVALTGDTITLQESFRQSPPRCNGLYHSETDLAQMLEATNKLAAITHNILPGHEPAVFLPGMGLER